MAACPICAYAHEHGSWPPDHAGRHCRDCHRSWTSTAWAHCTTCHATFTADSVAEKHWLKGRHVEPEDVPGSTAVLTACGPRRRTGTLPSCGHA